ncbi:MAG TPA: isoprenylcysteine carboxylmethyltransferase family protein [Chloroflexia bacterium]
MKRLYTVHGRLARPANVRRNMVKTLVQTLTFWGIFFGIFPAILYKIESASPFARYRFASRQWRRGSIVLFVLGGFLAWMSAIFMVSKGQGTPLPSDATRALVVHGPYRYVRNPMAIGSFAQGIAVGTFFGSPTIVAYVLTGMIGWNYFVRPWEENDLEWRFGAPYAQYRDAVRCWIPHLHAYESEIDDSVMRRVGR